MQCNHKTKTIVISKQSAVNRTKMTCDEHTEVPSPEKKDNNKKATLFAEGYAINENARATTLAGTLWMNQVRHKYNFPFNNGEDKKKTTTNINNTITKFVLCVLR